MSTWDCEVCTFINEGCNDCQSCYTPRNGKPVILSNTPLSNSNDSKDSNESKESQFCISCNAVANQCQHWCSSCYQQNELNKCEFCILETVGIRNGPSLVNNSNESKESKDSKDSKKSNHSNIPVLQCVTIGDNEELKLLRFPDGSYCSVSAVMEKKPTRIEDVSGKNPYCMVISLFVSPYMLLNYVKDNITMLKGQMLDFTTVCQLEDRLRVNIDIRYTKHGDNYNPIRNKNWKTLNSIVIKGNHYQVEGLGI